MLKQALQKFFILEGVSSAMIIRKDGEVVEKVESGSHDDRHVAAVVAFVMAESRAMATELGQENLSMVFVEFQDKALMSVPVNDDLYLVLIANSQANIAKIGRELQKNRDLIVSMV
jgi:predicted regulator of Ras-like GTPase activity (Roadblock/LC7/MglB family)